ncbi:MAG: T9SS type A sorting domain-containing protein [Phaeodactylibacter sp.]|nr:T9SS type A sorting domain-containing protein [Phaeodactylibacter sp.]MCB9275340.1 T9SS type A sorting domain-containing protein [Lewinellaceae bacterium]
MNKSILLICLGLALSFFAAAQPSTCFDFESLPYGAQYGPATGYSPGDVLFSEGDVDVFIQEIQYPNGNTGFLNAMAYGPPDADWLNGQFIFLGNNSLLFDFSAYPGGAEQLCFNFFDGGGVENFAVNGSPVSILQSFGDVGQLSIPGVTIDVSFNNTGSLSEGTVCLSGNVQSLLIGGQEFGLDNLCYNAFPPPACPLENLQAEIVSCDSEGNFNIEVDFDWLSPLTVIEHFDILVDGEPVAYISQADLPYLLEGVQPLTDALEFTLTVCQNDNPGCCRSVTLQKQCPEGSCVEFEGLDQNVYGSSAGTPPGTEFYSESNVGLRLIPFQSLFWTTTYGVLVVLDEANDPTMAAASGQYLKFESINAVFDLTNYPDAIDSVKVDFYYNGGAINIAANGASILIQNSLSSGMYALSPTVTLKVAFNPGSATEGQLCFIGDIESLLIGGSGDFRIDNFCINPITVPCELSNLSITPQPCNSTDPATFYAEADFDYQGVSDSFELFSDGSAGGHYAYSDLPVSLGPIPINNLGIYAFYVKDLGAGGCYLSDTLQIAPCTNCAFQGLTVNYVGQTDAGQTLIELDFALTGPTLIDFFTVYFNDEPFGQFGWNEVPVQIAVPCLSSTIDAIPHITVCEGQDHCCVTLPLFYVQPCPPQCDISNLSVDAGPCNPNGVFNVKLDFDYQNVSDTFELWLNGNATGQFYAYSSLPIILSPFVAPTPELVFTVVDSEHPDCGASVVLPPQNCNPCPQIDDVVYHLTPCNDNGYFYLVIDDILSTAPALSNQFQITINGQSYGTFNYGGLPFELGPLAGNGAVFNVAIFTQNTTNCAYTFEFGPVNCNGNGCPLEGLDIISGPVCYQANGYYYLKMRVDGAHAGDVLLIHSAVTGATIDAVYNGDFVEVELPIDNGAFLENLTVCLANNATGTSPCCLDITFDVPCGPCWIQSVDYHVTPCTAAGTFGIVIDHINPVTFPADIPFHAIVNGQSYGPFSAASLPVTIGYFPGGPNAIYHVLITADNTASCAYDFNVGPVNCTDCPLESASVIGIPTCIDTSNGSYAVAFEVVGAQETDLLRVTSLISGNTVISSYEGLLFINLPNTNLGYDKVRICLLNDPSSTVTDCCITLDYDIACPTGCPWSNIGITPNDCNADGYYTAVLDMDFTGPALNSGFLVESDNYLEDFSFANLPVTIGPFPGNGEARVITLYIPGTNCVQSITILSPDCNNGGCAISNVVVEPHPCNADGLFMADVGVQASNPGSMGYLVFADGQINGPFSYSMPFVTIGPFAGDGTTVYDFLVLDLENPTCYGYAELGPIECNDNCDINALVVDPLDCNPDGTYNLVVDFQVSNPGNDFFDVYAGSNNTFLGYYPIADLPLTIENFPASGNDFDRIKICINDHPDCCSVKEFPAPDCNTGDCNIYDVEASLAYCDSAGFYVQLHFGFDNVGNDGYKVQGNGQVYGTYSYNAPFPVIGPFPPELDVVWELVVRDVNHPDCSGFTTFTSMYCTDSTDNCIQFDIFDDLQDTLFLADYGQVNDSIYTEDNVTIWTRPIPWVNTPDYFGGAIIYPYPACNIPNDGAYLYVSGGVEFDFSAYTLPPDQVTFDLGFACTVAAPSPVLLSVNGDEYQGSFFSIPDMLGGVAIHIQPISSAINQYIVSLEGPVESFEAAAIHLTIDNICFEGAQLADDDNCLEFASFDNVGIDTLANYGHPDEMDYTEAGVHVTAQAIEWNGQNNYFTGVYATDGYPCGFGDVDAALQFGGALRFDFTGLSSLPNRVSFDLAFCAGQDEYLRLNVNGSTYSGSIQNMPAALPNGIGLAVTTTDDGEDWHITIEGHVEALAVGGNLTLDNLCYELAPMEEEVWPGDANHDNIAHHVDLLNVGLAYGAQGPARATDSQSWMSFSADNWAGSFANGLNYKHADCNGDGIVDEADRNTIVQNYGLTHGPLGPVASIPGTDTDPPAYADFPAQVPNGASFNVPIIVGSADEPVEDVYGIAFTVEFDPAALDPNAIHVVYPVSWFGEPGVNTMSIDRTYASEGQIEIAITRIDQNNVSGYGQVAYIIGIIDDIAGLTKSEVSIGKIKAIRKDETIIPLRAPTSSFTIMRKEEPPVEDDINGIFSLFPNPTGDWVTVTSRHGFEPEELRLMTPGGQVLKAPQEGNQRISLEGLPTGTYILRIRTGKTLVNKLIVKY